MAPTAIEIPTSDGKKLLGTLYTPSLAPPPYGMPHKLPALVLAPTFTATQLMGSQNWAKHFTHHLWLAVITFDSRGFGLSASAGEPHEVLPQVQLSDLQDVITFASSHSLIDPAKIALWGSGLSGGHVLHVAAVDKRVKAVISQTPMVNGWVTLGRRVRYDEMPNIIARFAEDRVNRCGGGVPEYIPVVSSVSAETCALPGAESFAHFNVVRKMGGGEGGGKGEAKDEWVNKVTLRSMEAIRAYVPEALIERISPTPLLMVVARDDRVCGADLALKAYQRALEPKEVRIVEAGHYSVYTGEKFEGLVEGEVQWLKSVLGL
ncbi:uncharacterized protein MKZ38_003464 [Zalerion maritima]|uniref:AB hydrolase-1 domain-containing protein n=1 Tax=Zalerion maritima TaxID=339359 RepID=A0AAD5RWW5_9PEZI|nr:uncharacterized protein MKZ38_003464 [Zalerion maritima]